MLIVVIVPARIIGFVLNSNMSNPPFKIKLEFLSFNTHIYNLAVVVVALAVTMAVAVAVAVAAVVVVVAVLLE